MIRGIIEQEIVKKVWGHVVRGVNKRPFIFQNLNNGLIGLFFF